MPLPIPIQRRRREADVFQAIASPVRRALLDKLSSRDQSVRSLARPFDMSLPAVSQQLAVLRRAGLVRVQRAGRFRVYRINAEPLRQVASWIRAYERFGIARPQRVGEELRTLAPEERWR